MNSLINRDQYASLTECTYLNQASLGLIPRISLRASTDFLTDVAQHGNLYLSDEAEARILGSVRSAAAGLLGAPEASVAVIGGASEGLGQIGALLADARGEALLVPTDFPSVTYPWLAARKQRGMNVRWVQDTAETDLTESLIAAITSRTTVICVSAVQFATGSRIDVASLSERAHRVGAHVVIDVTQMAGAMPVSMSVWGADALVCSGYKWLSTPGGVAVLSLSEELAAAVPPIVGWMGCADPFDFKPEELTLAPGARRFEMSTMSYSAALGLLASIELLTGIGLDRVHDHADSLAQELVAQIAGNGWSPFRPLGERSASSHIISLRNPRADIRRVQSVLAGQHRVITSSRGGGIRVSLHAYNNSDDVSTLVEALATITPE